MSDVLSNSPLADKPIINRCFAFGVLCDSVFKDGSDISDFEMSYLVHVYDSISAILREFRMLKE